MTASGSGGPAQDEPILAGVASHSVGRPPVSERLLEFAAEAPWERGPILAFMRYAAGRIPPGARVLDVGAGDAPYAELFAHADYVTLDWESSVHEGARSASIQASADDLPVADASIDAVVLTQVLEHVRRPAVVMSEIARILRPGGTLFATVPLVWELHEEPHDYWRYTAHGLRALLADAGLGEVAITPRSDSLSALAQLMTNVSWSLAAQNDNPRTQRAAAALRELALEVAELAPLDLRSVLPLGYTVEARR
jgi:SAM-dependent methyltransferase